MEDELGRLATIPSVGRIRPEAVTSVELVWKVPPPVLPILPAALLPAAPAGRRPRVTTGPVPVPAMAELTAVARAVAEETSLPAAVKRLQQDAIRLLKVTDALCVWIDWPRRMAFTINGRASAHIEDMVLEVAGSGRRATLGSSIIEPVGPAPARAALALRKPSGVTFQPAELTTIATLTAGISPALDRLIASARRLSNP